MFANDVDVSSGLSSVRLKCTFDPLTSGDKFGKSKITTNVILLMTKLITNTNKKPRNAIRRLHDELR